MLVILGSRRKDVEESLALRIDLQHAGHVAASVAIIRCAPDGAQTIVVEHLVSFLAELVGPEDVRHVVYGQELLDDLCAKGISRASRGEGEFVTVGIWV